MKASIDKLAGPFLCIAGGAVLLILSTKFPAIADELKISAGAVSTLWFKVGSKKEGGE